MTDLHAERDRLAAALLKAEEALRRARGFIEGPGDREGPVIRQIDGALSEIPSITGGGE